jgi:hypothetical protein
MKLGDCWRENFAIKGKMRTNISLTDKGSKIIESKMSFPTVKK